MASTTSRLGLEIPAGTDDVNVYPPVSAQQMGILDAAVLYSTDVLSSRPAATAVPAGYYFRASDTGQLFFGDGTVWHTVGSRQYHSWTASASTEYFGPIVLGSWFPDPLAGETVHIVEAVIHCVTVGSPTASTFAVQWDHGSHGGSLSSIAGLDALTPGTTQSVATPSSLTTGSALDRIAVAATNAGTSLGVTIQVVTDHFI